MDDSFLLSLTYIFEEHDLIDVIRQLYIDFENDPNEERIKVFITYLPKYLDNDLPANVLSEFISTISVCIKNSPQVFIPLMDNFYNKPKLNSNYSIIFAYILSDLVEMKILPNIQDYNSFISSALKEISPQLQNESQLIILGHEIPIQFKNDLIINLLLCTDLTEQLIYDFFPFLFNKFLFKNFSKFDCLIQKVLNSDAIKILPQTSESKDELYEFLLNKDFDLISKMNKESFSIVKSAILYSKSGCKIESIGLSKETVLPFVACISILTQKYGTNATFSEAKMASLIYKGIQLFQSNGSPLITISIDLILENLYQLWVLKNISTDDMFKILSILSQQLLNGQYLAKKTVIVNTIFELSNKIDCSALRGPIKAFFNQYGEKIALFILQYSSEFFECKELTKNVLNLLVFDATQSPLFCKNVILKSEDICKTIYFFENMCSSDSIPQIFHIKEIESYLASKFNEKYEAKSWNDAVCIANFMKNKKFVEKYKNIQKLQFPDEIKCKIVEYVLNEFESIDDFLSHILSMPFPESENMTIQILFEKMIQNEEMLELYLTFVVFKYDIFDYDIGAFLNYYSKEYENWPEKFIEATLKTFKMVPSDRSLGKSLIRNIDFSIYSLKIPEFGSSIVTKLFKAIDEKPNNHQAFFYLKSISHTFPLLFYNRQQEVFDHVFPALNGFPLLFKENVTEKQKEIIQTSFSAFSFLVSIFKLPVMIDHFVKTISNNISQYTDAQIACFFSALNYICGDLVLNDLVASIYIKCNFFEKVGEVLERKISDDQFGQWYKMNIYLFLGGTYNNLYGHNNNLLIQIEEVSKFDSPLCEFYDKIFNSYLTVFYKYEYRIDGINYFAKKFIHNSEQNRSFWLTYEHSNKKKKTSDIQLPDFIQELEDAQKEGMNKYGNISPITPFTVKMTRYIVTQPFGVYNLFLSNKTVPFYASLYERTLDAFNKCKEMHNYALLHPDEKENFEIECFDRSSVFSPLFCQPALMKNIILHRSQYPIQAIAKYKAAMLLMLDVICQQLSSVYENDEFCESPSSINSILSLIGIFYNISGANDFYENFSDKCGNKLLDIVLSPRWRNNKELLMKTAELFNAFKIKFPNRIVHLIGLIMISNASNAINCVSQLYKKLDETQCEIMDTILTDYFDSIIGDKSKKKIIDALVEMMPSLVTIRKLSLFKYLENKLNMFSKQEQKDPEELKNISDVLNELAPKRVNSISLTNVIRESSIPPHIHETSPHFWNLFGKHKEMIIDIIDKDPMKLDLFSFLLRFPELISFSTRSSYFRKKMKSRIKDNLVSYIYADRSNLLETSFESFNGITKENLMNKFRIHFKDEKGDDQEGLTREWFTELAKEIFDHNHGLFVCSGSKFSYRPNSLSNINPNHLQYFKFAGLFVARALIQGICIDAHLTTSFLKQILHRTPKLNDLQDIDEDMYNSLTFIQGYDDVESLDLTFSIDEGEFGATKTILLKENGDNILVTSENKNEYIGLRQNYIFNTVIKDQIKAFTDAFDSLIPHEDIKLFTPDELDLLICGIPEIDVEDFRNNTEYENPFDAETPVVKMFFNVISRWDNEKKAKLLLFMTGSSRVPSNGFREFCEVCKKPLLIASGGDRSNLAQAHTCFNMLCLPQYESEEELNDKLLYAIYNANGYEIS